MSRQERFEQLKLKYITQKKNPNDQKNPNDNKNPNDRKKLNKKSKYEYIVFNGEKSNGKTNQIVHKMMIPMTNQVDISPTADVLSPILNHNIRIGRYGPHVSIKNGFLSAVQTVHSYKFNCCQIFTQSPQGLIKEKPLKPLKSPNTIDINNCKIFAQKNNIEIWIHCPYTINLCRIYSSDLNTNTNKININKINTMQKTVIHDMKNAILLGAKGCVVHVGKLCAIDDTKLFYSTENPIDQKDPKDLNDQTDQTNSTNQRDKKNITVVVKTHEAKVKEAILNIKYNIEKLFTEFLLEISNMYSLETIQVPWLLIETAAGQGSEFPITIQELRDVWLAIDEKYRKYIGFCVDTCHVFASALCDLRFPSGTADFVEQWNELIGWEHVKLIHWNDSLHDFGTKKDRHAKPGSGYIGVDGLDYFKRFATITGKSIVSEWDELEELEEKTKASNKQKQDINVNVKITQK